MRPEPITTREFLACICTISLTQGLNTSLRPCPYICRCSVAGHCDAGMLLTVKVVESPTEPHGMWLSRQAPLRSTHADEVLVLWHTVK